MGVLPKNFGPLEYSTGSSNEIVKMTVNFNFRYWTDIGKYGGARPQDIPSFQFPNVENIIVMRLEMHQRSFHLVVVLEQEAHQKGPQIQDVTLEA